ncbi:uncharacterized protein BKCO1_1500095 [Diplodia corticola]|uniref:DUF7053 domain-containing protein n=1 Tax=Diplodia corticola TaxID=236234 RepID=A0A1J9R5F3_9PEZI|nr:uncharacterized protein BKCO1_1500095 [Diplodia corticola]OJD35785.1 hypothetical protein BKCO1_1500095 [Diplodia corticola]
MSISSYINTTFTVTFTKPLPTSRTDNNDVSTRDAAIALLHDHPSVLTLNPLVVRYERVAVDSNADAAAAAAAASSPPRAASSSPRETYLVWDSISYIPGTHLWDGELGFRAEFEDTPDGTTAAVVAPLGFRSRVEWRIVRDDGGGDGGAGAGWRAEESVTAACPWGLRWFVEGTMRRAHEVIMGRFVQRVGEAVGASRGLEG